MAKLLTKETISILIFSGPMLTKNEIGHHYENKVIFFSLSINFINVPSRVNMFSYFIVKIDQFIRKKCIVFNGVLFETRSVDCSIITVLIHMHSYLKKHSLGGRD